MTIAEELVNATTPGRKAAVTRKMNAIATKAALEGKNPVMVIAGFKAAAKRLQNARQVCPTCGKRR